MAATAEGMRIYLWHMPRSGSTALTKCLSATEGLDVWFEPFYYCFTARLCHLRETNENLPESYEGNEDVYRRASDILGKFVACRLEPERLS